MINEEDKYFLQRLGRRIRLLREEQNLSKVQLAFELNTSESSIRRMEKGQVNIGAVTLYRLSVVLNIPLSDLLKI